MLFIDTGRLARVLWLAAATVIAFGLLREVVLAAIGKETVLQDLRHFAFDAEHSLPAWFETLLMAAAAATMMVIATLSRAHDRRNRLYWTALAGVFLLLSIDEAVAFHEVTMAPLRAAFGLDGFLYFSWVVIAAPLLVVFAGMFMPFVLRLPPGTRARFVVAGSLFVAGAFGLELVGGYLVSGTGFDSVPYVAAASAEESLEIIALTLFLSALLQYLSAAVPSLRVDLRGT